MDAWKIYKNKTITQRDIPNVSVRRQSNMSSSFWVYLDRTDMIGRTDGVPGRKETPFVHITNTVSWCPALCASSEIKFHNARSSGAMCYNFEFEMKSKMDHKMMQLLTGFEYFGVDKKLGCRAFQWHQNRQNPLRIDGPFFIRSESIFVKKKNNPRKIQPWNLIALLFDTNRFRQKKDQNRRKANYVVFWRNWR